MIASKLVHKSRVHFRPWDPRATLRPWFKPKLWGTPSNAASLRRRRADRRRHHRHRRQARPARLALLTRPLAGKLAQVKGMIRSKDPN